MAIPQRPNQRWSLDFVSDSLAWRRRFRVLCIIDDFSRECLASVVDTSISGHRVARELDRIAQLRGYPRTVVSDTDRLRDECLNEHLFSSLRHARHLIAAWRDGYNHHRPLPASTASPRGSSSTGQQRTKP